MNREIGLFNQHSAYNFPLGVPKEIRLAYSSEDLIPKDDSLDLHRSNIEIKRILEERSIDASPFQRQILAFDRWTNDPKSPRISASSLLLEQSDLNIAVAIATSRLFFNNPSHFGEIVGKSFQNHALITGNLPELIFGTLSRAVSNSSGFLSSSFSFLLLREWMAKHSEEIDLAIKTQIHRLEESGINKEDLRPLKMLTEFKKIEEFSQFQLRSEKYKMIPSLISSYKSPIRGLFLSLTSYLATKVYDKETAEDVRALGIASLTSKNSTLAKMNRKYIFRQDFKETIKNLINPAVSILYDDPAVSYAIGTTSIKTSDAQQYQENGKRSKYVFEKLLECLNSPNMLISLSRRNRFKEEKSRQIQPIDNIEEFGLYISGGVIDSNGLALPKIDFKVKKGETGYLYGASGIGKSSLEYVLQLFQKYYGEIVLGGKRLFEYEEDERSKCIKFLSSNNLNGGIIDQFSEIFLETPEYSQFFKDNSEHFQILYGMPEFSEVWHSLSKDLDNVNFSNRDNLIRAVLKAVQPFDGGKKYVKYFTHLVNNFVTLRTTWVEEQLQEIRKNGNWSKEKISLTKNISQLSHGQKQLLVSSIAQSYLKYSPYVKLIVLDEIEEGLSDHINEGSMELTNQLLMMNEISQLAKEKGTTITYITHDPNLEKRISSTVREVEKKKKVDSLLFKYDRGETLPMAEFCEMFPELVNREVIGKLSQKSKEVSFIEGVLDDHYSDPEDRYKFYKKVGLFEFEKDKKVVQHIESWLENVQSIEDATEILYALNTIYSYPKEMIYQYCIESFNQVKDSPEILELRNNSHYPLFLRKFLDRTQPKNSITGASCVQSIWNYRTGRQDLARKFEKIMAPYYEKTALTSNQFDYPNAEIANFAIAFKIFNTEYRDNGPFITEEMKSADKYIKHTYSGSDHRYLGTTDYNSILKNTLWKMDVTLSGIEDLFSHYSACSDLLFKEDGFNDLHTNLLSLSLQKLSPLQGLSLLDFLQSQFIRDIYGRKVSIAEIFQKSPSVKRQKAYQELVSLAQSSTPL